MAKQQQQGFVKWMGPTLDALRELGGSGTPQEVYDKVAESMNVPDKYREERTATGIPRYQNQVCWARQYLVWEGYLENSKRGIWMLSATGAKVHLTFEEGRSIFIKWRGILTQRRKAKKQPAEDQAIIEMPGIPVEEPQVEVLTYKEELVAILRSISPRGFEELCLRLLRENGFENLKLTPRSRDGGIDGISTLRINPFVSFRVLFQCKRYNGKSPIKREQIGDFRNAMIGRADKGIFITTGYFSADAEREANREGAPPIELVDCDKLIEMFEQTEMGLNQVITYEVNRQFFDKYMDSN